MRQTSATMFDDSSPQDLARRFRHHVHALQLIMQRARMDKLTLDDDYHVVIWVRDAAQGAHCESLDDVEAFVGLALRPDR